MKKAIFNKTPKLSSFYVFSIDKRQAKGYHVFNTKQKCNDQNKYTQDNGTETRVSG